MNLLFLFTIADTIEWKDLLLAGAVLGNVAQWFVSFKKSKNDDQTSFRLDMAEFRSLLAELKKAHQEAIEDDTTIAKLESEIEKLRVHVNLCVGGHRDWADCKAEVLAFLSETETILETAEPHLYARLAYLRGKLEAVVFLAQE